MQLFKKIFGLTLFIRRYEAAHREICYSKRGEVLEIVQPNLWKNSRVILWNGHCFTYIELFLSIDSLELKNLVFAFFLSFPPVKKRRCWDDSSIFVFILFETVKPRPQTLAVFSFEASKKNFIYDLCKSFVKRTVIDSNLRQCFQDKQRTFLVVSLYPWAYVSPSFRSVTSEGREEFVLVSCSI